MASALSEESQPWSKEQPWEVPGGLMTSSFTRFSWTCGNNRLKETIYILYILYMYWLYTFESFSFNLLAQLYHAIFGDENMCPGASLPVPSCAMNINGMARARTRWGSSFASFTIPGDDEGFDEAMASRLIGWYGSMFPWWSGHVIMWVKHRKTMWLSILLWMVYITKDADSGDGLWMFMALFYHTSRWIWVGLEKLWKTTCEGRILGWTLDHWTWAEQQPWGGCKSTKSPRWHLRWLGNDWEILGKGWKGAIATEKDGFWMVFDGFWMVFVCWVRCDLAIRATKAPSVHRPRRIDDLQPSEWFREKRGVLSELREPWISSGWFISLSLWFLSHTIQF